MKFVSRLSLFYCVKGSGCRSRGSREAWRLSGGCAASPTAASAPSAASARAGAATPSTGTRTPAPPASPRPPRRRCWAAPPPYTAHFRSTPRAHAQTVRNHGNHSSTGTLPWQPQLNRYVTKVTTARKVCNHSNTTTILMLTFDPRLLGSQQLS